MIYCSVHSTYEDRNKVQKVSGKENAECRKSEIVDEMP